MFPDDIASGVLKTAEKQTLSTGGDCCMVRCSMCCLNKRHNNLGFAICSIKGRQEFSDDDEGLASFVRRISKEFMDLVSEPKTTKLDLTE